MSKACKCDICGRLFNARMAVPDLTIERYRHPYGSERLDLCDECQTKLEQFVNGGNNLDSNDDKNIFNKPLVLTEEAINNAINANEVSISDLKNIDINKITNVNEIIKFFDTLKLEDIKCPKCHKQTLRNGEFTEMSLPKYQVICDNCDFVSPIKPMFDYGESIALFKDWLKTIYKQNI